MCRRPLNAVKGTEYARQCLHLTVFIDSQVTLFSVYRPVPITARKEIHRLIWRVELLAQCWHSLAKRRMRNNKAVLRKVHCSKKNVIEPKGVRDFHSFKTSS